MEFLRKNRMMITVAGVVLLVFVRMLTLLLGVDPVNGYSRSLPWLIGPIAVAAVFAIVAALPSLLQKRKTVPYCVGAGFRVATGIAAGVFLVKAVTALVQLIDQFQKNMLMYRMQIPLTELLVLVLAILTVGFFYLLCRCGGTLPSLSGMVLILGPIGLYIIRLIDSFMAITVNPSVDTYAFFVVSGGLTLFFLSNLGRALLNQSAGRGYASTAALAALSLSLSSVATLIFSLLKAPVYAGLVHWSDLVCDMAMLLVAVFAMQIKAETVVQNRRHAMVGSAVPCRRRRPRRRGIYIPKH